MPFKYTEIVPWGRCYDEYVRMFSIKENELNFKILGCGDGPACFNYEMKKKHNNKVISLDPIYKFTKNQIQQRINETYQNVINQTKKNKDKFIWTSIKSVEELGNIRMQSMMMFLEDYEQGKKEKRYIEGMLPEIPFEDKAFDLALSSHFLFLYSDNLSLDFHIKSIEQMCRVAKEVRIFPLVDVNINRSKYLDKIKTLFSLKGKNVFEEKVNYEFQIGGNKMLRIINK